MTESVPPTPFMDREGLLCFEDALKRSRCYMEFGSGGSTVHAATVARVPVIISVDSDKAWAERVKASIGAQESTLYIEHCDIGEVGEWGTPKGLQKIEDYWTYIATPWRVATRHNLAPDTILIDGRFRVASFLFSLISARIGTLILFDDYFDRPHYFVAERFCQLAERHGRMGAFVATKTFAIPEICERIAQYSIQWA